MPVVKVDCIDTSNYPLKYRVISNNLSVFYTSGKKGLKKQTSKVKTRRVLNKNVINDFSYLFYFIPVYTKNIFGEFQNLSRQKEHDKAATIVHF